METTDQKTTFCTKCGSKNNEGNSFCSNCGNKLQGVREKMICLVK